MGSTDRIVLSLIGKQGSGKSTLGSRLARHLGTERFEVSDVVKALHQTKSRSELPDTAKRTKREPDWLAAPLYDQIAPIFAEGKKTVVLTGTRELALHQYLEAKDLYIYPIQITAESHTRYERLMKLGKIHTAKEFLDHELRERSMGLLDICATARYRVTTSDKSDPDEVVKQLVERMIEDAE